MGSSRIEARGNEAGEEDVEEIGLATGPERFRHIERNRAITWGWMIGAF